MAEDVQTWVVGIATIALAVVTAFYAWTAHRILKEQRVLRNLQAEVLLHPQLLWLCPARGVEVPSFVLELMFAAPARELELALIAGNHTLALTENSEECVPIFLPQGPKEVSFNFDVTSFLSSAVPSRGEIDVKAVVTYKSLLGHSYGRTIIFKGVHIGPKGGYVHRQSITTGKKEPFESLAGQGDV